MSKFYQQSGLSVFANLWFVVNLNLSCSAVVEVSVQINEVNILHDC